MSVCVCVHDNSKNNWLINLNKLKYMEIAQMSSTLSDQGQGHSGILKFSSI